MDSCVQSYGLEETSMKCYKSCCFAIFCILLLKYFWLVVLLVPIMSTEYEVTVNHLLLALMQRPSCLASIVVFVLHFSANPNTPPRASQTTQCFSCTGAISQPSAESRERWYRIYNGGGSYLWLVS